MTSQLLKPAVKAPLVPEPFIQDALATRPVPVASTLPGPLKALDPKWLGYHARDVLWVARHGAPPHAIEHRLEGRNIAKLVKQHGFEQVAIHAMRGCTPKQLLKRLDKLAKVAPPEQAERVAIARARATKLANVTASKETGTQIMSFPADSNATDVGHYFAGDSFLNTNKSFLAIDGTLLEMNRHGELTVVTSPFETVTTFTQIGGRPIVARKGSAYYVDRKTYDYIPMILYGAAKEIDEDVRFSAISKRSVMFAAQKGDATVVYVNNFLRQYGRSFTLEGAAITGFDAGPLNRAYIGRADGNLDVLDLESETSERHALGAPVQGVITAGDAVVVAVRDGDQSKILFLNAKDLAPIAEPIDVPAVKNIDIAESHLVVVGENGTRTYELPPGIDGHERTQRSRAIFGRAMVRFGNALTQSPDYREFFTYHTQQHTKDSNKLWHVLMDIAFWTMAPGAVYLGWPAMSWAAMTVAHAGSVTLAQTTGFDLGIAAVSGAMPSFAHAVELAAATPVVSYGCGWTGHLVIERNQPATFGYPVRSLGAEPMVMANHGIGIVQWLRDNVVDGARWLIERPKATHASRGMEHQEDIADAQAPVQIEPQLDARGE